MIETPAAPDKAPARPHGKNSDNETIRTSELVQEFGRFMRDALADTDRFYLALHLAFKMPSRYMPHPYRQADQGQCTADDDFYHASDLLRLQRHKRVHHLMAGDAIMAYINTWDEAEAADLMGLLQTLRWQIAGAKTAWLAAGITPYRVCLIDIDADSMKSLVRQGSEALDEKMQIPESLKMRLSTAGVIEQRERATELLQYLLAPTAGTDMPPSTRTKCRRMRSIATKTEAHLDWIFMKTGKYRKYASWDAIERRKVNNETQKAWLESHVARGPEDEELSLKTLHEASLEGGQARAWAIAKGLELIMQEDGLQLTLVTFTNPAGWSPAGRNYTGASPQEANRTLKHRAALFRKALNNASADLTALGFMVTEPQETGSPHVHMMVLSDDSARVIDIALGYREITCPCGETSLAKKWHLTNVVYEDRRTVFDGTCPHCGEAQAGVSSSHQIDARDFEYDATDVDADGKPRQANAAAYLSKYLFKAKGLSGDEDTLSYQAWRTGVGCRTISFFGFGRGFISKFQAVSRSLHQPEGTISDEAFIAAQEAAKESRWSDVLRIVAELPERLRERRENVDGIDQVPVTITKTPLDPITGSPLHYLSKEVPVPGEFRRANGLIGRQFTGAGATWEKAIDEEVTEDGEVLAEHVVGFWIQDEMLRLRTPGWRIEKMDESDQWDGEDQDDRSSDEVANDLLKEILMKNKQLAFNEEWQSLIESYSRSVGADAPTPADRRKITSPASGLLTSALTPGDVEQLLIDHSDRIYPAKAAEIWKKLFPDGGKTFSLEETWA